jgi:hypothetical protein
MYCFYRKLQGREVGHSTPSSAEVTLHFTGVNELSPESLDERHFKFVVNDAVCIETVASTDECPR